MAANDYYNTGSRPALTPYTNQYNEAPLPPLPHEEAGYPKPTRSPFEAPFDDHVYPMASHKPSQSSFGQDSAYYGARATDSNPSFGDDIPLKNNPGVRPHNDNSIDHVYDAPPPMMANTYASDDGQKRKGMGLLSRNGKRIPWVTYLLTLIQVAVFIGEIAVNGKPSNFYVLISDHKNIN